MLLPGMLAIGGYLGMAVVEWFLMGQAQTEKHDRRVMAFLMAAGLALALSAVWGLRPVSPWQWIQAIFEPIGTPFLKVEG